MGATKALLRLTARVASVRLLFTIGTSGPPRALARDYVVCRESSTRPHDRLLARRARHMHMLLPMRTRVGGSARIVNFFSEDDTTAPAHVLGRASDERWSDRTVSLKTRIAEAAQPVGQFLFLGSLVMGCVG